MLCGMKRVKSLVVTGLGYRLVQIRDIRLRRTLEQSMRERERDR